MDSIIKKQPSRAKKQKAFNENTTNINRLLTLKNDDKTSCKKNREKVFSKRHHSTAEKHFVQRHSKKFLRKKAKNERRKNKRAAQSGKRNKLLDIPKEFNYNPALWLKERISLPRGNVAPNTAFLPARIPKAAKRFFGVGAKRAGKS